MIPPYNFMDSSRDGIFGKLIIRYVCVNSKKNLRKQIIFYPKGMGGCAGPGAGIFSRLKGAGNLHPPFSFWSCQKENGPCTVQEKKTLRGGIGCRVLGKSLPAAWIAREFGSPGPPSASISAGAPV